jgi:hypothetical protein
MSQDMTYNGSLAGVGYVRHAVHAPIPDKILAIPQQDDTIRIYDYAFLNFNQQITLPKFIVLGNLFTSHGRFVFSNSTGTSYYVVVQADPTSGLLYDYGVVTFSF